MNTKHGWQRWVNFHLLLQLVWDDHCIHCANCMVCFFFFLFFFFKMSEEAKRSMIEWQQKLDKVTKDSEERISELQQKLAKVSFNYNELFWLNFCLLSSEHLPLQLQIRSREKNKLCPKNYKGKKKEFELINVLLRTVFKGEPRGHRVVGKHAEKQGGITVTNAETTGIR